MHTIRRFFLLSILCLPYVHGHAAEPLILPKLDDTKSNKRFISLDSVRSDAHETQHGVSIVNEKKFYPLRTDRHAMDKGMMVIDRTRVGTLATPLAPAPVATAGASLPATSSVKVTPELDRESEEIEGNTEINDPVLALFDADDAGPLGSFADVMLGRTARSAAGLARHLVWPIPLSAKQYVSSGYGIRNDPFHGRPTFHGGLDIAASVGTSVQATADGLVMQVTQDKNYGKYITLQHADGTLTRYGHLSAQSVKEGQRVRAGQTIGAVGSTGRSTGAHLDYRVSKNGIKYDPLSVLSVPASVPLRIARKRDVESSSVVDIVKGPTVASKPLPKRPMVIQVQ